jgi:hypothetical protein
MLRCATSGATRQHRQHAHDKGVQFVHVVLQELGRGLVADLAVSALASSRLIDLDDRLPTK